MMEGDELYAACLLVVGPPPMVNGVWYLSRYHDDSYRSNILKFYRDARGTKPNEHCSPSDFDFADDYIRWVSKEARR